MPSVFADADTSPYQPGSLFLGYSDTGREIGIQSERHFLAVCGSGSGKGASLIIPNLLRWSHNSLVIDPGGGNVRATWQAREAMGQTVHVIDPARVSLQGDKNHGGIPERLLKSFNPLARLDPSSRTYAEDVGGLADGLVMRHEPRHARWDDGGATIIAGLIDFITTDPQFRDHATLPEVRRLLIQSPDDLKAMFEGLAAADRPALCRAAAVLALADLKDTDGGGFILNAQQNTKWLDYTSMLETLGTSTCELSHLKSKPCTIYLVIDPDYMDEHARFLRLFVRTAISAMAKGGDIGRECLFILDEFFSLGKITYLQKVAGLMRKNGVHLWPILQNLKQLPDLYGPDGADTFVSNADALIFFGNDQDKSALDFICNGLGTRTAYEATGGNIPTAPFPVIPWGNWDRSHAQNADAFARAKYEQERAIYDQQMRQVGRRRFEPEAIAAMTGKGPGDKVARSMIVFASAGRFFKLRLAPYFLPPPPTMPAPAPPPSRLVRRQSAAHFWEILPDLILSGAGCAVFAFIGAFVLSAFIDSYSPLFPLTVLGAAGGVAVSAWEEGWWG